VFVSNEDEMRIKEIIKLDFCLPPPKYINHSIQEFKKLSDSVDSVATDNIFIRIPEFGIANFGDLNKINKLYSAIQYQQNLKNLIKWIDSSSINKSIKKTLNKRIIKTKKLYTDFRNNLSIKIVDLCTLAEQNYINDSVIDSILKIFGAYKIQTIDYNDFVLLSVYFYTFITNKDFASAFKLLENFLDRKEQVK